MKVPDSVLVLVDQLFEEKVTWPELIKRLRMASGLDIFGAEKIALSHQGWRRLCNHRINHDSTCRKQAIRHIKYHGQNSLVALHGETFAIVEPEEI